MIGSSLFLVQEQETTEWKWWSQSTKVYLSSILVVRAKRSRDIVALHVILRFPTTGFLLRFGTLVNKIVQFASRSRFSLLNRPNICSFQRIPTSKITRSRIMIDALISLKGLRNLPNSAFNVFHFGLHKPRTMERDLIIVLHLSLVTKPVGTLCSTNPLDRRCASWDSFPTRYLCHGPKPSAILFVVFPAGGPGDDGVSINSSCFDFSSCNPCCHGSSTLLTSKQKLKSALTKHFSKIIMQLQWSDESDTPSFSKREFLYDC